MTCVPMHDILNSHPILNLGMTHDESKYQLDIFVDTLDSYLVLNSY